MEGNEKAAGKRRIVRRYFDRNHRPTDAAHAEEIIELDVTARGVAQETLWFSAEALRRLFEATEPRKP